MFAVAIIPTSRNTRTSLQAFIGSQGVFGQVFPEGPVDLFFSFVNFFPIRRHYRLDNLKNRKCYQKILWFFVVSQPSISKQVWIDRSTWISGAQSFQFQVKLKNVQNQALLQSKWTEIVQEKWFTSVTRLVVQGIRWDCILRIIRIREGVRFWFIVIAGFLGNWRRRSRLFKRFFRRFRSASSSLWFWSAKVSRSLFIIHFKLRLIHDFINLLAQFILIYRKWNPERTF